MVINCAPRQSSQIFNSIDCLISTIYQCSPRPSDDMLLDPLPISHTSDLKPRRAALKTDTSSLSPDKAWNVRWRQSEVSAVSVAVSSSDQPWTEKAFQPQLPPACSDEDEAFWPPTWQSSTSRNGRLRAESVHGTSSLKGYCVAKQKSHHHGRDKLGKPTSWSRFIPLEPAQIRLDNKRKRVKYSEDQRRSYETEIHENIPHMSEISSDDTIQTTDV